MSDDSAKSETVTFRYGEGEAGMREAMEQHQRILTEMNATVEFLNQRIAAAQAAGTPESRTTAMQLIGLGVMFNERMRELDRQGQEVVLAGVEQTLAFIDATERFIANAAQNNGVKA